MDPGLGRPEHDGHEPDKQGDNGYIGRIADHQQPQGGKHDPGSHDRHDLPDDEMPRQPGPGGIGGQLDDTMHGNRRGRGKAQ